MVNKKSPSSATPPADRPCDRRAARDARIGELEEQLEWKSRRLAAAEHRLQLLRTRWEKDTRAMRAKAAEHARKVDLVAHRFAAVENAAAENKRTKSAIVSELCEGMTLPTYRQCVEDARSWGLLDSARPPPVKRKAAAQLTDREREQLAIRYPTMAEVLRKKY